MLRTFSDGITMTMSQHGGFKKHFMKSLKLRSHMRGAVAERRWADFDIPAPLPRVCSHIHGADAGRSAISWGQWWFGARGFEAEAANWVLDPFFVGPILLPLRLRSATAYVWTHVMICVEANFPPASARACVSVPWVINFAKSINNFANVNSILKPLKSSEASPKLKIAYWNQCLGHLVCNENPFWGLLKLSFNYIVMEIHFEDKGGKAPLKLHLGLIIQGRWWLNSEDR